MYFNDSKIDTEIKFEDNSKTKNTKKKLIIIASIILLILVIVLVIIINLVNKKNYKEYLVINGNEDMVIYQNEEYNDPGYNAYDSKGKNLNDNVIVSGEVDYSTVGEYTITYTLNEIIKTRYIKVIPKIEDNTFLILKGSRIIYMHLFDEYVEPGFDIINTTKIINKEEVKIENNLNNSTPGTYKIKYKYTKLDGETISKERTIIVTSNDIDIKYTPDNYTNGNVSINIKAKDNYYKEMILPNNEKTSERDVHYEVSNNGKYQFKTYNSSNEEKIWEILIDNIDKEVPVIKKCEVISNTVNVTATDNIEITNYTYYNNNEELYKGMDNKYKISKTPNNVIVKVTDIAGNEATKSCKIITNNTQTETKTNVKAININTSKLASYIPTNVINSAQVAVFSGGKVKDTYNIGCDDNTSFYISSATKTILGIMAVKMQEDGIVNLDTSVDKYWHKLNTLDFNTCSSSWRSYTGSESDLKKRAVSTHDLVENKPTLRNCLTHSSTIYNLNMVYMIPGDTSSEYFGGGLSSTYNRAAFMLGHTYGQLFERGKKPGVTTNYNYQKDTLTREHTLAGTTMQIAMKETLTEYMNRTLLKSVNTISSSGFKDGNTIYTATTYQTSAKDLAKLIAMVANDGVYEGKRILSANSIKELEKVETNLKNQTIAFDYIDGKYTKYGSYSNIENSSYYKLADVKSKYVTFITYNPKTTNGFVANIKFTKDKDTKAYDIYQNMQKYFYSLGN